MPRHKLTSTKRKKVSGVRKTHRRKRRMSGMGNMNKKLEAAGAVILGAVAAREINTVLGKIMPSIAASPLMSGLLQAGIGFALPMIAKGDFMDNVGLGMVANGGMVAIVSTGIISGPGGGGRGTYQLRPVNGFQAVAGPSSRLGSATAAQSGYDMVAGTRRRRATKHVY